MQSKSLPPNLYVCISIYYNQVKLVRYEWVYMDLEWDGERCIRILFEDQQMIPLIPEDVV